MPFISRYIVVFASVKLDLGFNIISSECPKLTSMKDMSEHGFFKRHRGFHLDRFTIKMEKTHHFVTIASTEIITLFWRYENLSKVTLEVVLVLAEGSPLMKFSIYFSWVLIV